MSSYLDRPSSSPLLRPREVICAVADIARDAHTVWFAVDLAERTQAGLTLLHVREHATLVPVGTAWGGEGILAIHPETATLAEATRRSNADFDRLLGELAARQADIRVEVDKGPVLATLRAAGRRSSAVWMVVGDGGRGRLASSFAASAARRLMAAGGCPLVIVPRRSRPPETGREPIACLVQDDQRLEGACRTAADLALAGGAAVLVLTACRQDSEVAQQLLERSAGMIERFGVPETKTAIVGPSVDAVRAACASEGAVVLVTGTPPRVGRQRMMTACRTSHGLLCDANQVVVISRA